MRGFLGFLLHLCMCVCVCIWLCVFALGGPAPVHACRLEVSVLRAGEHGCIMADASNNMAPVVSFQLDVHHVFFCLMFIFLSVLE